MPIFTSKYSAKKSNPRRSSSAGVTNIEDWSKKECDIAIKLGERNLVFSTESGNWREEGGSDDQRRSKAKHGGSGFADRSRWKQQKEQLQDENRVLKLKLELLMDMFIQAQLETDDNPEDAF